VDSTNTTTTPTISKEIQEIVAHPVPAAEIQVEIGKVEHQWWCQVGLHPVLYMLRKDNNIHESSPRNHKHVEVLNLWRKLVTPV
jgi:hypothetical protein